MWEIFRRVDSIGGHKKARLCKAVEENSMAKKGFVQIASRAVALNLVIFGRTEE